ncbi:hypothetical protein VE03_06202 [Pseudogymnoascus sp. 23342-1-I1]|nr:hypothetical protein VE03_06202 [Pseudogymnoascus sp. 23342-1-I1]
MKERLWTTLTSLIWGLNWHLFKADVPADHEDHELGILMKQCQYFGPYPLSLIEPVDLDKANLIIHIMNTVAGVTSEKDVRKPFLAMRQAEISKEDRAFIELLRDEWFKDPGDDFASGNRST